MSDADRPTEMTGDRLGAFTDAVIAIIITIMVLELPVPHGSTLEAVRPIAPLFAAYVLSFVNVGIYWLNHHHMLHLAKRVDGRVLLANLFLLFWLSLIPWVIRWAGETEMGTMPVAAYGVVLTMAALAYLILERSIIHAEGSQSGLREAFRSAGKERLSLALYAVAVPLAFVSVWIAVAIYFGTTAMWLIPDSRVEERIPDPD